MLDISSATPRGASPSAKKNVQRSMTNGQLQALRFAQSTQQSLRSPNNLQGTEKQHV